MMDWDKGQKVSSPIIQALSLRRGLQYRFRYKKAKGTLIQRRRKLRCIAIGMLAVVLGFLFFRIEARIGALSQQAAVSKLNGVITKDVNRLAAKLLSDPQMQGMIEQRTNEAGEVLSVNMNPLAVNRFKSALAIAVQECLDVMDVIETTVPIGMLFSDTIMTGVGIRVPIKVFATNEIIVEIEDSFASAGINQTKYSLSVKVTVPARIAGVFRYEDTKVVTEIPLAETILVGEVPKAYRAH